MSCFPTSLRVPKRARCELKQQMQTERVQTLVIGGGQAGLSTGYHLRRRGLPFVILDANQRIGDAWRNRWDSLRLFTSARFDGLDGMPFPAPAHSFPTKDEMADYLASYARRFDLPVRTGVRVDRLSRQGNRYVVTAGQQRFEAEQVVVARPVIRPAGCRAGPGNSIHISCNCIQAPIEIRSNCERVASCW